jgi:hypothetical protein
MRARKGVLRRRDGHGRHHCVEFRGEHSGGGPITTTDIANADSRADRGLRGDALNQLTDSYIPRLMPREPEPVVNVLTPDVTVKVIQVIVVTGNIRSRNAEFGRDQPSASAE